MKWLMKLLKKAKVEEKKELVPFIPRPIPDVRQRLSSAGYRLLEIPIRSRETIRGYKVVASGNGRSLSIEAKTADEAINTLGKMLGLIAR